MTYRPCTCGHAEGDHRSNGSSFPHPSIFGVCLISDCGCREYVSVERLIADRDRYRKALEHADYELAAIADNAPEWVGDQLDNVRAGIKDALASVASGDPVARETTPPTAELEQNEVKG